LGEESADEHLAILRMINPSAFSFIGLAGKEFYNYRHNFPFSFFETTDELLYWLKEQQFDSAVFYIKGSRGMKMEVLVEVI
jgi:UDP-N-acetylmuramoyl-tripeptide--D-alanyl-D-alanine ligase